MTTQKTLQRCIHHGKDVIAWMASLLLMISQPYASTLFWVGLALMLLLLIEPLAVLMGWIENPFKKAVQEAHKR